MPTVYIEPDSSETQAQSLLAARRITTRVFTIGRRSGTGYTDPAGGGDLVIAQVESYTISRRHCGVEITGEGGFVVDIGGRRGTSVDGVRIGGRAGAPQEIKLESESIRSSSAHAIAACALN